MGEHAECDLEREWMAELRLCFLCGVPLGPAEEEDESGLCDGCRKEDG
jgi:hypothetical protein